MAAIIAFLLALGIINAPEEATQDMIDQYQSEIVATDFAEM